MSVEEGNKLIAEFMGFESHRFENSGGSGYNVKLIGYPEKGSSEMGCAKYGTLEDNTDEVLSWSHLFKYNISWDWFMPVYKKGFSIQRTLATSQRLHWGRRFGSVMSYVRECNLPKAFSQMVEAIIWYNSNK